MGSFNGPELIQLAGHFPAGFTHIEEQLNTLAYSDHQKIVKGKDVFDVGSYFTSESSSPEGGTILTIDPPPPSTDSDQTTYGVKIASRYHRFQQVGQQAVKTMKAVGMKALNIHRTIRGTNNKKEKA